MQDRYAGDIGDFIKLALLRALSPGHQLGIAWYRTLDETHNGDGRHVNYLDEPNLEKWRALDPELFENLRGIVARKERSVASLEAGLIQGDVTYHNLLLTKSVLRQEWFEGVQRQLAGCNLVFADPDNGIAPGGYRSGGQKAIKSITYPEISRLYGGKARSLVIYHHQSRFRGGHLAEIQDIGSKLGQFQMGCIAAIRARARSPRVF